MRLKSFNISHQFSCFGSRIVSRLPPCLLLSSGPLPPHPRHAITKCFCTSVFGKYVAFSVQSSSKAKTPHSIDSHSIIVTSHPIPCLRDHLPFPCRTHHNQGSLTFPSIFIIQEPRISRSASLPPKMHCCAPRPPPMHSMPSAVM
jgi:hypothetical protein